MNYSYGNRIEPWPGVNFFNYNRKHEIAYDPGCSDIVLKQSLQLQKSMYLQNCSELMISSEVSERNELIVSEPKILPRL